MNREKSYDDISEATAVFEKYRSRELDATYDHSKK
jgi:hypothetical protein